MNKKKIAIIGLVGILAIASFSGFLIIFRSPRSNSDQVREDNLTPETISGIAFTYLTDRAIKSPILSYDATAVWYLDNDNVLIRQDLASGDKQPFPLPEHSSLSYVLWPDEGNDFIAGTPAGRSLFNSASNTFIPYPSQVKYLTWLRGGNRIAYIWADNQGKTLSVADKDLKNFSVKAQLDPNKNYFVSAAPNAKSFMLYTNDQSPLSFLVDGLNVLEPVTDPIFVKSGQFSPDGRLYAYIENRDGVSYLQVMSLADKQSKTIGLVAGSGNFTWSLDGQYVYWSDKSQVINSYNLNTQVTVNLLSNNPDIDTLVASTLIPAPDNHTLFLVDASNSRLARLQWP